MKKQVLTALALMSVAAASCKVDSYVAPAPVFGEEFIISADCGNPDTRMERDGAGKMYWSPGDEIGVFMVQGTSILDRNERFAAMLDAPSCSTQFRAVVPGGWEPAEYYAKLNELWGNEELEPQAYEQMLDEAATAGNLTQRMYFLRESDKQLQGEIKYQIGDGDEQTATFQMVDEGGFSRNHIWTVYAYQAQARLHVVVVDIAPWKTTEKNYEFYNW